MVFGGRTFLRRVLDLMNTLPSSASQCRLTLEFHRDMYWWDSFLDSFNGLRDFTSDHPITAIQTDASKRGLGAYFWGDWLYIKLLAEYPQFVSLNINFKETLCIIYAAFRWGHLWKNQGLLRQHGTYSNHK